jgi:aminoglycoside phosphotransferase (APT) family kinase protein
MSEHPEPPWPAIADLLGRALGEPVHAARPLSAPRIGRRTWAAEADRAGALVVKARFGDRAHEKTRWCAARLPLLRARGYPVPTIVWHGMLDDDWHLTVQHRLPGQPLTALTEPLLTELLRLVELQAHAGVPAEDRNFAAYVARVLFDDWDQVWTDAASAGPAATALCDQLRAWLQPVWGLELPPADFTCNDMNLSNILSDGHRITGVVDWDEFGLGSRASDLVAAAFDCTELGDETAADRLWRQAAAIAGHDGMRCLVSYGAITHLAYLTHVGQTSQGDAAATMIRAIVGKLDRWAA